MIKRIKIRDFKSIREVDIQFDPVTILVGRSGTGKSNVVQAIRFLRNILLNPQGAINFEWGWDRIIPVDAGNTARTSIEVLFSVPGEAEEYTYHIGFIGMKFASESLKVGKDLIFAHSLRERVTPGFLGAPTPRTLVWDWDVAPNISTLPNHEAPVLGQFPTLENVVYAYAALCTSIGYYHFPASVLDTYRNPPENPQISEFTKNIPGLSDTGSNYMEIVRRITQDFHNPTIRKNILASLKQINPSVASIELNSLLGPQNVIVGHTAKGRIFDLKLEQESDGFRRFYAHLLALYQTPPKLTLIFEEPENAIFPGALSLLAEEFKAAPRENRGQIIFTTHSPLLLDSFDVENVRVVDMRDGNTTVGPVSKEQQEAVRERLLTTGELLIVESPRQEVASHPGK
jgi:predicted ATPase